MLKAVKYRIYPNKTQEELISKHFGCCRFVYNFSLSQKIKAYEKENISLSHYDLNNLIPKLKKEFGWLSEVNSQSLQQENVHLEGAFRKFFREKKGFPNYKTKKNPKKSFTIPQRYSLDFEFNKIKLPKLGLVKAKLHRRIKGKLKSCTLSQTSTGKYFLSVLVDDNIKPPKKQKFTYNTTIGIDVGIKHFATFSTGEKIDNPKYLKNKLDRLKILQKRASKKQKDSQNRKKANLKVALLHEQTKNQRKDFLHKLTTRIVGENQAIAIESLNIAGMVKNHHLAQAISDVSWSEFFRQIEYKCDWTGKNLLKIGRFEPSSKICSNCGEINLDLELKDRKWTCSNCNTKHDRDENASTNIKKFALQNQNLIKQAPKELRGEPLEMSTIVESTKEETKCL